MSGTTPSDLCEPCRDGDHHFHVGGKCSLVQCGCTAAATPGEREGLAEQMRTILHDHIDGDFLIGANRWGEADVPMDRAGASGVVRWAVDALTPWLDALLAQARQEGAREALTEFVDWIASNAAYNGAPDPGQALYNEGINRFLPDQVDRYRAAGGTP